MENFDKTTKEQLLKENEILRLKIAKLEGFESERNKVEEALQKSNSLLSSIFESPDNIIMFALDLDYNYLSFNKAHLKEMKYIYDADIEVGKYIFDCIPNKKDRDKILINYKRVLKGERFIEIQEYGDSENRFWYELIFNPIIDTSNNITGFTVFVTKITNRKQTEIALKESNKLLKTLTAQVPGVIYQFLLRPDGTSCFPFSSMGIKDIYSVTPEQVQSNAEAVFAVLHPDDLESVSKKIQQSADELSPWRDEYRVILPGEKEPSWREGYAMPERLEDGSTLWHGFITNIDQRKQVEEALKSSEESYENIFNNSPLGILHFNSEGVITDCNDELIRILGSTKEKLVGLNMIKHLKDQKIIKSIIDTLETGSAYFNDYYTSVTGQNTKPIVAHFKAIYNFKKEIIGGVGMVEDITERKLAEDLLSEQQLSLSGIIEGTNAGTWDWNIQTGGLKLNERWAEIMGYTLKDLQPIDINTWINNVHPDDLPEANDLLDKVINKELDYYDVVFRQPHKDGRWVWVNARGKVAEWADDGKPLRMSGTHLDITDRKNAEEEQKQSEERFKRLFDGLGDAVFVTLIGGANKGRILEVNTAALTQTGYSRKELLKMNIINDLSVAGSGEISAEEWEEKLLKGETVTTVEKKKRKDGTEFWTEMIVTQIDFRGEKASLSINHDITNRKRAEQIQKALYNISNAVIVKSNLEKLITFIQKELGKIIDTRNFYVALYDEKSDTLSMPFLADEMEDRTNIPASKTLTKYVIKTQKTLLATKKRIKDLEESGHIGKFGAESEVWLGVPLKIEDKVTGVLAVQSYTDENAYTTSDIEILEFVSDQISISIGRKKTHNDLLDALKKATESDRLKSAFLATISHELRTPLNAIIGFSDLINGDWPLEEIISFAKTINESGTHLLSIVEEIFDITLIETGETSINNKEENLHKILKSVNKTIKSEQRKLNKESIDLDLEIPETDAGIVINTDAAKLKQILLNLLKNALKFTHKGHVKYGYSFIKKDDIKMIRFYVKDTGIGVHKEMHDEIFTTFRQVDESLSKNYGGTGIGLSISKKLTELLGGDIWIESVEGEGSTFYFTLPVEGSVTDNHQFELGFVDEIAKVSTKDESTKEKTFLIVEDDQTSFEFLEIVFEKPDIKIIWAKDGKEAIEYCKNVPEITLVLMDINMQVMDGYEATRQIKKFRPQLPIIAQTAFAIAGDREKTLEAGCDDYIAKPIVIEELMSKIEKWI